ncbi:DUF2752 domain-containing protein [Capnocytophaga sp. G2]|uniref:DUF2752 domain-containing protein n=1 Tax=Capnocytophaga sp. G2 TaxID=3110695 RepID=UPI002B482CF6|nr:DUF2752 domain-containing protein [Capnocytophaga sp. G2]MEB3003787.1 DUF2752 domain-containing protein [Capnocytophaga sp. G2]
MLSPKEEMGFSLCIFKHITHLPCPACGTTRAVISLFRGDGYKALYINPLGIITSILLITIPIWLFIDLFAQKTTLFRFYNSCENFFKRPLIFVFFCILILFNWIWNIYKGI